MWLVQETTAGLRWGWDWNLLNPNLTIFIKPCCPNNNSLVHSYLFNKKSRSTVFAVPYPKPQEVGREGSRLHCRVSCPEEAPNTSQQSLSFLQLGLPAPTQAQGACQPGNWPTLVRISPQTPSPKACRFLHYLSPFHFKKKKKFLFLLNFNPGNGETVCFWFLTKKAVGV